MKKIKLPNSHLLFQFFPLLESQDISFDEFRKQTHSKLKEIYDESDKFILQKEIDSEEHVNFRYPIMTPYYIKEDLKDKHVMHVGSRFGEICQGISYYAKELTSVERHEPTYTSELKRDFKCKRNSVYGDVKEITDFSNIDLIHSWTFYDEDIFILKHLYENINKETNIYLGVPQQADKLSHFLNNLKIFADDTDSKIDYVPILWDESFNYQKKYDEDEDHKPIQFPITQQTAVTQKTDSAWNPVEIFDNQCGIFLLFKITIHEGK